MPERIKLVSTPQIEKLTLEKRMLDQYPGSTRDSGLEPASRQPCRLDANTQNELQRRRSKSTTLHWVMQAIPLNRT
jgi:hypothetical protein